MYLITKHGPAFFTLCQDKQGPTGLPFLLSCLSNLMWPKGWPNLDIGEKNQEKIKKGFYIHTYSTWLQSLHLNSKCFFFGLKMTITNSLSCFSCFASVYLLTVWSDCCTDCFGKWTECFGFDKNLQSCPIRLTPDSTICKKPSLFHHLEWSQLKEADYTYYILTPWTVWFSSTQFSEASSLVQSTHPERALLASEGIFVALKYT